MDSDFSHLPVMAHEIVALFAPVPDGVVVDATVGGGGHAAAILSSRPGLRLVGLDRDLDALAAARVRLAPFGDGPSSTMLALAPSLTSSSTRARSAGSSSTSV